MKPHIDYKVLVRAWNNYKPKADPDEEVRLTIRVHSNKDGRIERRTAMKYATQWLQDNAPRRVSSFIWIQSFHPGTHEEA